jgi:hypothetical protein
LMARALLRPVSSPVPFYVPLYAPRQDEAGIPVPRQ